MKNYIDCCFNSRIAEVHGVIPALLMNRIIWSVELHKGRGQEEYFIEDKWWMYDTMTSFQAAYPFVKVLAIKVAIKRLEESGLLYGKKMNASKSNHTKWYAVNEDLYHAIIMAESKPDSMENIPSDSDSMENILSQSMENIPSDSMENIPSSLLNNLPNSPSNSPVTLPAVIPLVVQELTPLAKDWLDFAIKEQSWSKPHASWTVEHFAKGLVKVQKYLACSPEALREILNFIKRDKFWGPNALSPASLLNKSSNDRYKIDNILTSMKPKHLRERDRTEEAIEQVAKHFANGGDIF